MYVARACATLHSLATRLTRAALRLRGTSPQLKAASGLALLDGKKYKLAARRFVEVPPELGSEFSDVLAAQDVALYGGLTALASFDREELKSRVRARPSATLQRNARNQLTPARHACHAGDRQHRLPRVPGAAAGAAGAHLRFLRVPLLNLPRCAGAVRAACARLHGGIAGGSSSGAYAR